MDSRDDDQDRSHRADRLGRRLQALSTAEIARRAAVRSGTWPASRLPRQGVPQVAGRVIPMVPTQRDVPPES